MKIQTIVGSVVLIVALGTASPTSADVVTDWNIAALNAIRVGRTPPPRASRALAILHVSIYDAVNGISRTHEPYIVPVPGAFPASASKDAAASAAAHRVLVTLFPAYAADFDDLYATSLAVLRNSPQKSAGIAWGEFVAQEILAWRAGDGSDAVVTAPGSLEPGDWIPTPPAFGSYLLPQWGTVMPFAIPGNAAMRPPGPPALYTDVYAAEYDEVKALGAAVGSTRSEDQSLIALFWADGAGTETPPGHWNSIARDVGAALGNMMEENARLFALLNIALADAGICAWDAKYAFHFWRPVTAIQYGDDDGNDATVGDPSWNSFIATPPFPDYVSGHSTFSGAAATILAMFYGTDDIPFTTGSDFLPGVTRSFPSFSAAADEAALSRLYGGIHFRSANEHGLTAGITIGQWTFERYMQPKGNRSRK